MRTKPRDKLYCGVNRISIRVANPKYNLENMRRFYDFVTERYKIHIRKDVLHKEAPWTNDGVLQQYKFCNVRREHDRQSQYLIKNISTNPDLALIDKVINTFYFRAWNNWDTMRDFGGPWSAYDLYNTAKMKHLVRPIYRSLLEKDPERKWWSSAYNQGGTKQAWRYADLHSWGKCCIEQDIPLRVFHIGYWLEQHDTFNRLMNASNQKAAFEIIKEIQGFSDFLAYQVFVDLTYIKEFPFSENEFVVAGPGCKKGLDYLFDDYDGMSSEEALFWLRDNIDHIFSKIMAPDGQYWDPRELFIDLPEYDRYLNIMSLENCMCELSKYIRTIEGTGRPRVKYKQHN